jgi:hypothetical protein
MKYFTSKEGCLYDKGKVLQHLRPISFHIQLSRTQRTVTIILEIKMSASFSSAHIFLKLDPLSDWLVLLQVPAEIRLGIYVKVI